jgi:hypothetical protein
MKDYLVNTWKEQISTNQNQIMVRTKIDNVEHVDCFLCTILTTRQKVFTLKLTDIQHISKQSLKRFKGVELQILPFAGRFELVIILLETTLEDIFILLINDIIEELQVISTELEAINAIHMKINEWRRLFERLSTEGLNSEQQVGLYGELFVIKRLIENDIDANQVVQSWLGTTGSNHDFSFGTRGLEVKTTRANYPTLKITNEMQLDTEGLEHLFVILLSIDVRDAITNTLPSIIGDIQLLLIKNGSSLSLFNQKLQDIGYFKDHEDQYKMISYHLRDYIIYEIKENFPRIDRNRIGTKAIFNVSYQINLAYCEDYQINEQLLTDRLNHGKTNKQGTIH